MKRAHPIKKAKMSDDVADILAKMTPPQKKMAVQFQIYKLLYEAIDLDKTVGFRYGSLFFHSLVCLSNILKFTQTHELT